MRQTQNYLNDSTGSPLADQVSNDMSPASRAVLKHKQRNDGMGRSYRNRVAGFIHRMSENPEEMDKYKSNPSALPSANLNEAKLRTFAVDPMATRTGMPMSPLGDHVMHTM